MDILSFVQRLSLSRGQLKSKRKGKVSIHFTADQDTVDTINHIILSVNQLSVYGAVAAICEEFEDHQDRTGEPVILVGQSVVLGRSQSRNSFARWRSHWMTKSFGSSTFNKLNRFHQKTNWVNFVRKQDLCVLLKLDNISWPGTLLILDNFKQWLVANTPFHETTKLLNQKGGSKEIWELDLYWKSRPVFQHFKYGIEIRIKSVNQDDSHSWARISYGTVKYVNDSIEDDTEKSCRFTRRGKCTNKLKCGCSQVKGKSKTSTKGIYWHDNYTITWQEKWIDIEPSKQDLESYDLSKKVINLLRHNQKLHREEDGAIQFYKIKIHLRDYHLPIQNWSDNRWLACLAAGGGSKRRYQYCSDNLGSIIYLRALQRHSGSNLIDPALQDNVLIGPGIFPYIYHVGSNFNLHSIVRNGLVPGSQNLSRRQYVFFLPVDPRNEDHKDPEYVDYSAPRLARYLQKCMEETSRCGILGRYWSWNQRRISVLSDKIKRNYSSRNTSSPLYCKSWKIENGEKLYERQYLSPRPPPKISLKHDLNWSKGKDQGSTVETSTSWKTRSTVTWRSTSTWFFQANPIP